MSVLTINTRGDVSCLYTELINLSQLGLLHIERASNIEFNNPAQVWEVKDHEGEILFASPSRQACLDWEVEHLQPTKGIHETQN